MVIFLTTTLILGFILIPISLIIDNIKLCIKVCVIGTVLAIISILGLVINIDQTKQIKKEYILELINQDSVKIKSKSTNKIYYSKPEEIYKILEKDNL